jgi:hypothetical protein
VSEQSDCPRLGKWIRGCQFEARYDTGGPGRFQFEEGSSAAAAEVIEAMKPKVYVRDVCVTCGRTVEKQETGA